MNVLITGGAGYLGSTLVRHLIEVGMQVVVYDKLLYGGEGLLSLLSQPKFELVVGDIRDSATLKSAVKKADAIVHLAALVGEEACLVNTRATTAINTQATEQLVKMATELGIRRMIFSSTCSNYGVVETNTVADENSQLRPLSLYAQTKIAAERSVLKTSAREFWPCVLRLGTICGLSAHMRFDLLINNLARNAAVGKKITIFAPQTWRPFLHIRDAAEVIYRCLIAPSARIANQIFNVVGENYQKRELSKLVIKHFPQALIEIKESQAASRDYRVKAKRIADILHFYPKHTIEEAFIEVADAVKNGVFVDPFLPMYTALPTIKQFQR